MLRRKRIGVIFLITLQVIAIGHAACFIYSQESNVPWQNFSSLFFVVVLVGINFSYFKNRWSVLGSGVV